MYLYMLYYLGLSRLRGIGVTAVPYGGVAVIRWLYEFYPISG